MKKQTSLLLFILLASIIYSCKKDKVAEPLNNGTTTATFANYSKLEIGNYWIYERYTIDTAGTIASLGVYDSCFVEKDTLIHGDTFLKVYRPNPYVSSYGYVFLRDSLHYIVNDFGSILFSSQDFSTEFNSSYIFGSGDTIAKTVTKMADKDVVINTPAGAFSTSSYQKAYYMYPSWSFAGNPRTYNTRYAENIGIVNEILALYVSSPLNYERRLIRYHVK